MFHVQHKTVSFTSHQCEYTAVLTESYHCSTELSRDHLKRCGNVFSEASMKDLLFQAFC